jgi:hypothetical protein
MPTKQRLTVKIFRIIEGEAEGPLAIWVFLILALAALGFAVWGLRP